MLSKITLPTFALITLTFLKTQFATANPTPEPNKSDDNVKLVDILKIISEPENGIIHHLLLELNEENSIDHIIRQTQNSQQKILPSEIKEGEVVLARASDIDAVLLSCKNCEADSGGLATIRYLYNGISKSYKTFNFVLKQVDNTWSITTEDHTPIHNIKLVSRVILGRTIGIKKIVINVDDSSEASESSDDLEADDIYIPLMGI